MRDLARLSSRIYNTPLLITPDKAAVIEKVFRAALLSDKPVRLMEDDYGESAEQRAAREHQRRSVSYAGIPLQRRDDKPYAVTQSGIAIIPVLGTLVQRGSWLDSFSGLTAYETIAYLQEDALADPMVRAALFEIDSPGGEGNGLIELASRLFAARGRKPMWAHANEMAYSAAYWFGSQAERLYVPISGGVGSIGALALHVDQSKRDAMQGYAYTVVYAGARKVDLSSHQELNTQGRKRLQVEVDRFHEMFAGDVARGRGISADAAFDTEAALLTPAEAVEGRFVDGIATLRETVALLEAELSSGTRVITGTRTAAGRPSTQQEESIMDPKNPAANTTVAADQPVHTAAELQAAVSAAREEGVKAGTVDGVKAERERVRGILAHAEAKDRPQLALNLALESDMGVEQAAAFMVKSAKEAAGGSLTRLMAGVKNPAVGADADADDKAETGKPRIDTGGIYASRRKQAQLPN